MSAEPNPPPLEGLGEAVLHCNAMERSMLFNQCRAVNADNFSVGKCFLQLPGGDFVLWRIISRHKYRFIYY